MSLPRFFSRTADAVMPVAAVDRDTLAARLDQVRVAVVVDEPAVESDAGRAGHLLAVNLAARLYPHLHLTGPTDATQTAAELAHAIAPGIDVTTGPVPADTTVAVVLDADPVGLADSPVVHAAAQGWAVDIDGHLPARSSRSPGNALSSLAAAAVALGEAFRTVFAAELGDRGRRRRQPGGFHLVTLAGSGGGADDDTPDLAVAPYLGDACLVGAGAVGNAALLALRSAGARGRLAVVDHETVALSNLQRYVLTTDADVGVPKVELAARLFAASGLAVEPVPTRWGADPRTGAGWDCVLVALDSAADRLAVAAGLPRRAYNAWTQPADVGWSWHEQFGLRPCLGCLYYPDRPRPSQHELLADVLEQPALRMLAYLTLRTAIGTALPGVPQVQLLPVTADTPRWLETSLLDDLVAAGKIGPGEAAQWAGRDIASLYRDGVCAGGLLSLGPRRGDDAVVPLAHQSALAGIMLATSALVAADERLDPLRPRAASEARLDMLRGFPQVLPRPRERTNGCFCSDPEYLAAARTLTPHELTR